MLLRIVQDQQNYRLTKGHPVDPYLHIDHLRGYSLHLVHAESECHLDRHRERNVLRETRKVESCANQFQHDGHDRCHRCLSLKPCTAVLVNSEEEQF